MYACSSLNFFNRNHGWTYLWSFEHEKSDAVKAHPCKRQTNDSLRQKSSNYHTGTAPPWNLLAQHQTLQFLHSISRIEATRNDLEGETVSERCHMRWEVMLWLVSMANDYGSKVDPWSDVGVLSSKSSHFLGWQEVPNVDPYSRCTDDMKPHCLEFIAPSSLEFYK
jgi:hypothetical protein